MKGSEIRTKCHRCKLRNFAPTHRQKFAYLENTVRRFAMCRLALSLRGRPFGLYVRRWVRWNEGGLGPHKKNPAGAGTFLVLGHQSR